mmetsp:Transcript_55339/g.145704  ORF Transcript_55339/g.145704 Transcript_55339/m.145704 type:complete len:127 (-) Transcript_55339:225-605(-)
MASKGGWSSLPFAQKTVYASAILNVSVVGFVWVKRQLKMADREAQEVKEMEEIQMDMDMGKWSESNKFRCFYAAQQYRMMGTAAPEEEESPEVRKLLEVMAQCREELYRKLPAETPSMQPLHRGME